MFSHRDSIATVDASKNILDKIKDMLDNILTNLRPVDNRTDQFMPIDDR